MSPKNQAWVQRLQLATAENLRNPEFSVLELAAAMNLSHAQLFRKVKAFTGYSPSQYIREIRLQQAKLLLETGQSTTIKAMVTTVGLKDAAHFSKLFKERFGYVPSSLL